jgi:two-component system sensor histidine kinase AlgZ
VATLLEGGELVIESRRAGPRVVVTVVNPRDPDARRGGTGLGLDIVRRRLAGRFGEGASLTVEPMPDAFRTSVTLPVEEPV